MSIKETAKEIVAAFFFVMVLIIGLRVYYFLESKLSRDINPEAVVVIGEIQLDAFDYNNETIVDQERLKITKMVEEISKHEENMSFPELYKYIDELNYYNLPPLYWDELDENEQIGAFHVWENYMKDLMKQCAGLSGEEEANRCIKSKRKQIEKRKQDLFK
jgi:hypothetical protein